MRAREGDLIKTGDDIIFDVKGLLHPPDKIIAFPRYIPSLKGSRGEGKELYGKVYNLAERFQYLQQNAPQLIVYDHVFGETLCEVPIGSITKHFKPIEKLTQLRKIEMPVFLERKSLMLADYLKKKSGIPWDSIGISGSIMSGLFTPQSDIDPLVYGVESCRKVYSALQSALTEENSPFKAYDRNELQTLFDFRSKDTMMSFEEFARVESRKAFQGKFDGIDYFVRFVKDWGEIDEKYGDVYYENSGYGKVTGTVADDCEALFTPCAYELENVKVVEGPQLEPLTEVVSFRGRFCEQAKTGEKVVVQGKIEHVSDMRSDSEHYRIIIGNKPTDYMSLSQF